jgi:membrane-associated phospholipid phosphatase
MRTSEWIQGGFALILTAAAWLRPLPMSRRWITTLLAAFAVAAIAAARYSAHLLTPPQVSILRDWLTVALLLVPYWQTGQFFLCPNEKFQSWLIESDRKLLKSIAPAAAAMSRPFRLAMEYAYLSCYPLVPLGLAALYAAGHRADTATFWFIVLVPTYLCYAITPFFPALPARSIPGAQVLAPQKNTVRDLNQFVLKHGSIHAISFPSAHVASSLGVALVLLKLAPVAGILFLIASIAIAIAAVVGGYHYAIDVLLGAALTLIVYVAWNAHLIPSSLLS